jgi:hypothetical protein
MFWLKGCPRCKVTYTRIKISMGAMLAVSSVAITVNKIQDSAPLFLPLVRVRGRPRVPIYERLLQ